MLVLEYRPGTSGAMMRVLENSPDIDIEHCEIGNDGLLSMFGRTSENAVDLIRGSLDRYLPRIRFFSLEFDEHNVMDNTESFAMVTNSKSIAAIHKQVITELHRSAETSGRFTISELAHKTGLHRATLYLCIESLKRRGYIRVEKEKMTLNAEPLTERDSEPV